MAPQVIVQVGPEGAEIGQPAAVDRGREVDPVGAVVLLDLRHFIVEIGSQQLGFM
ncbi:MAG: hypothetical protein U5J62_03490 [Desulfurivibrio sp.]|nr:hypothetical protein [Desulfurivibrio sp.]